MVERGEIWQVDFKPPSGSEPGYERPFLVVQSDVFNASRISTVVCVAITSNVRLAAAPGNVLLRTRDTNLTKDSVANVSQIATIDRSQFANRICALPERFMSKIDAGLRDVLDLHRNA